MHHVAQDRHCAEKLRNMFFWSTGWCGKAGWSSIASTLALHHSSVSSRSVLGRVKLEHLVDFCAELRGFLPSGHAPRAREVSLDFGVSATRVVCKIARKLPLSLALQQVGCRSGCRSGPACKAASILVRLTRALSSLRVLTLLDLNFSCTRVKHSQTQDA